MWGARVGAATRTGRRSARPAQASASMGAERAAARSAQCSRPVEIQRAAHREGAPGPSRRYRHASFHPRAAPAEP